MKAKSKYERKQAVTCSKYLYFFMPDVMSIDYVSRLLQYPERFYFFVSLVHGYWILHGNASLCHCKKMPIFQMGQQIAACEVKTKKSLLKVKIKLKYRYHQKVAKYRRYRYQESSAVPLRQYFSIAFNAKLPTYAQIDLCIHSSDVLLFSATVLKLVSM